MTILVAEDTPVNAILLKNILERAGHTVLRAENGVEALELIDSHPEIELAAVDIYMPEMDGLELVRTLRERPATRDLPVVFVSASSDAEVVREAVALKSRGYILKPITEPSKVLDQIEKALAGIPRILADSDPQMARLGIGMREYRELAGVFMTRLLRARGALSSGSDAAEALREVDGAARGLGATRLVARLETPAANRENEALIRDIDAVIGELAQRGVPREEACPSPAAPEPASPSAATNSTASGT